MRQSHKIAENSTMIPNHKGDSYVTQRPDEFEDDCEETRERTIAPAI